MIIHGSIDNYFTNIPYIDNLFRYIIMSSISTYLFLFRVINFYNNLKIHIARNNYIIVYRNDLKIHKTYDKNFNYVIIRKI